MLSLPQFNALPYAQRLRHVWEQGLYLASRQEEASVEVKLYLVNNFFVEVRYYSLNEFEIISAFRTTRKLMPYVEGFDLRFLLE